MLRFFAFVIACCSSLMLQAQAGPVFPFLGQPVAAFRDSILCKDALHLDQRYDEYPACKSFLITPSTVLYRYGAMEFQSVLLFPAESGKVTSFSHMKSYLENDTGRTVKQDQALLKNYFSSYYGAPEIKRVQTDYTDDRSMIWKKDGIKIILMTNRIMKRMNVRLRHLLQLHIEME